MPMRPETMYKSRSSATHTASLSHTDPTPTHDTLTFAAMARETPRVDDCCHDEQPRHWRAAGLIQLKRWGYIFFYLPRNASWICLRVRLLRLSARTVKILPHQRSARRRRRLPNLTQPLERSSRRRPRPLLPKTMTHPQYSWLPWSARHQWCGLGNLNGLALISTSVSFQSISQTHRQMNGRFIALRTARFVREVQVPKSATSFLVIIHRLPHLLTFLVFTLGGQAVHAMI